jgi:predicted ATP-dependent endonuclease of OLD family
VRSFGDEVNIDFQDGLNIFIGPNAGGKSNLMDILNIVLSHFFIYPWRIITELDNETGFITRQYFQSRKDQFFNPISRFLDKHHKRPTEDQEIKITFKPEIEDVENINILLNSVEKLITFENKIYSSNYIKSFSDLLKDFNINKLEDKILEYTIKNYNMDCKDIYHQIFLNYLNNFELYSLLITEYNKSRGNQEKIQELFPPLIYFSPYRITSIRNLVINISRTNYFDLIEKYKKSDSKNISSTFELAIYYFANKFLYSKDDNRLFCQDEEVKFVQEYLKKLGYNDFAFQLTNQPRNREENIYEAILTKEDGERIEILKASSGEKEILNLLLGIFAFNVKNGVVIIDEPDVHLHPKWQNILLQLFYDLSKKRGIQFFIVTHSPHFVTRESIKNVIRVYRKNGESKVVFPSVLDETEKDLFQIVNVFNNTKIFFADKVVLVEGEVDNIIFNSILKKIQQDTNSTEIIEILDVKGKANFEKFSDFLKKWQINYYIIADLDYLFDIGDTEIKNLFQSDCEKIAENLKKKGSKDAQELCKVIEELLKNPKIEIDNIIKLKDLLTYLRSRYQRLKEKLSQDEKTEINEFIESKYKEKIYILKEGEIENYFNNEHFDINKAIEIAKKIENQELEIPIELKSIFEKIIDDEN